MHVASPNLPPDLQARLEAGGPVVAFTGAGISAESGLATFRGPEGLWEGQDPASLATPEAFRRDPRTVWRFYDWRRRQAARARPNAAHRALAAAEQAGGPVTVVTQNVDGLHERAGSRGVIRLHGSLWRLRCTEEGTEGWDFREDLSPLPPRCACGALLRPGVVWFGEALPQEAFDAAREAMRRASVVLVVGTSGLVYPAAALPQIAHEHAACIVEVNPEPTPLSAMADVVFRETAAQALPRILGALGVTDPSLDSAS